MVSRKVTIRDEPNIELICSKTFAFQRKHEVLTCETVFHGKDLCFTG